MSQAETPKEAVVRCEIDGEECSYEIATHLRNVHGLSVAEYLEKYPNAPVVHEDVIEFFNNAIIVVDDEGNPWRLTSEFDKLGFSAYGPTAPAYSAPVRDLNFEFDPEITKILYYAIEADQRPLLVGPPGTGKSELVRNMCAVLGWGFRRVNFNGQATPRTLFGGQRAAPNGQTYFQYGAVPIAMLHGECLLLDEIGFIDADMAAGLHPVMEPRGVLTLLENGGELVAPHRNFRIVGTDNVGTRGDMYGKYHGLKPLNFAFVDRWTMQIHVDYMDQATEEKVLRRKVSGLPRDIAAKMCKFAADSRKRVDNDEILNPVTFRQLLDWAAVAVQHRNVATGFKYAILNKASDEDSSVLSTLWGHCFPELT